MIETEPLGATVQDKDQYIDELEQALIEIRQWCDAYPVDIFTPISSAETKTAVAAANAAVRYASERLHGSWARHILSGVRGKTDIVAKYDRK